MAYEPCITLSASFLAVEALGLGCFYIWLYVGSGYLNSGPHTSGYKLFSHQAVPSALTPLQYGGVLYCPGNLLSTA